MAAAGHRGEPAAADIDAGVAIGLPAPAVRGADRIHDRAAQDVRQRRAEEAQQRQAQPVDAHVVVFPVRARGLQRSRACPSASRRRRSRRVRLWSTLSGRSNSVPDHSLVSCSRWRQVMARFCAESKPPSSTRRRTGSSRSVIRPRPKAMPGEHGEIALGDREGDLRPLDVAPARGDMAAAHDDAAGRVAALDRPERQAGRRRLAHRLRVPELAVRRQQVARPLGLVGAREGDRGGEALRIEARLDRLDRLPGPSRREIRRGLAHALGLLPCLGAAIAAGSCAASHGCPCCRRRSG